MRGLLGGVRSGFPLASVSPTRPSQTPLYTPSPLPLTYSPQSTQFYTYCPLLPQHTRLAVLGQSSSVDFPQQVRHGGQPKSSHTTYL